MVAVARRVAERVELAGRVEQQRGRRLLVDDARVSALPAPHHVDRVRVADEAERVAAVRRAEVDGDDHEMSLQFCRAAGGGSRRAGGVCRRLAAVVTHRQLGEVALERRHGRGRRRVSA